MRIDKYLKLARVIKRRTIAKDVLDLGLVKINDKVAKPASEVNVGDILTLSLGERLLTIKVENILTSSNKKTAQEMFTIIEDKQIN